MPVLYPLTEAAKLLGGISVWTLRKQISKGRVTTTRIGRRVFITSEEVERIRKDGLPSLGAS
jgi:excisionase family DNA binding protein